jgi:hypothetical protein
VTSTRLRAVRDEIERELAVKRREVEALDENIDVLVKVGELYRVLLDKLVLGQVQAIEQLATTGLQAVFPDQNLRFSAELGQRGGKVAASFYRCQGDPDNGGIKGPPLGSFGGGPSSFVSLVLRVLTLLRLKRMPLLLLDETLAAVSDEYIEATGKFLQRLAETSRVDILLVTHKPSFLDHAALAYQGESYPMSRKDSTDPRNELQVRRIKGVT